LFELLDFIVHLWTGTHMTNYLGTLGTSGIPHEKAGSQGRGPSRRNENLLRKNEIWQRMDESQPRGDESCSKCCPGKDRGQSKKDGGSNQVQPRRN
jgi:hypothetical protein